MKVNKNKNAKFTGSKSSKFNRKRNNQQKSEGQKRKALRKQARLDKKAKKHAYFTKKRGAGVSVEVPLNAPVKDQTETKKVVKKDAEKEKRKQQQKQEDLQLKRRRQFMLEENEREEKHIAQLEKSLKFNKRKSKSLPQLFVKDGLDYLLDVCDAEKIPHLREPELSDGESDFGDDLALATGQPETKQEPAVKKKKVTFAAMSTAKADPEADQSEESEECGSSDSETDEKLQKAMDSDEDMNTDEGEGSEEDSDEDGKNTEDDSEDSDEEDGKIREKRKDARKTIQGQFWEDIYGRLRDQDGNVVEKKSAASLGNSNLLGPHQPSSEDDPKKHQSFQRLKKQLKGHLNKLDLPNINRVTSDIETLYMHNIRNDMNNALIGLIMEDIVQPDLRDDQFIQKYALLIAALHANVGTEVGAKFLETIADKFEMFRKQGENYGEGKECDNLLNLLVSIYSFKVVHCTIIYNILQILVESFKKKDVDLLLVILKPAGFLLRKDDPLSLKNVILKINGQACSSTHLRVGTKAKVMFDDLMQAIRNNNMQKIQNYDYSEVEHQKKLLRSLVRQGNSIIELKISLDDLLNIESRGRWWIVGSAWSGQVAEQEDSNKRQLKLDAADNASEKILELARKQRMNTDIRKNIFVIIMTAEDYIDAFEKLLRLGLNSHQEREIIHVAIECCLQEKSFNPYYAFLMQRFCNSNRKYQMIVQFSVWDKIKEMATVPATQMSNLAHLLTHLFVERALAISVLKVIQFAEMDKALVRFLRQILLEILLRDPEEDVLAVFAKVAKAPKLHMFREGLRLFMRHFMLKNKEKMQPETHKKLEARIDAVEDVLTSCEVATKF